MPYELTLASARLGPDSEHLVSRTGGQAFGHVGTPDYRKLNPNDKIPTLVDGDLPVWESNTICRYLASKYGASFHLDTVEGMATCSSWMDWLLASDFFTCDHHLVDQMARTGPAERDYGLLSTSHEGMVQKVKVAEERLAESAFLAGESFSIADIPFGVTISRWACSLENWTASAARGEGSAPAKGSRPQLPHLEKYFARLQERPAFIQGCLSQERQHHRLPPLEGRPECPSTNVQAARPHTFTLAFYQASWGLFFCACVQGGGGHGLQPPSTH